MHKRKGGEPTKIKPVPKPTSLLRLVARNFGGDKDLERDKPYSASLETIVRKSYDGRVHSFRGLGATQADPLKAKLVGLAPRLAPKRSFQKLSPRAAKLTQPVLGSRTRPQRESGLLQSERDQASAKSRKEL